MAEPRCPICGAPVLPADAGAGSKAPRSPLEANPVFPFCSRRCQLVDLGRWLDGDYRVAGSTVEGYGDDAPPTGCDEEKED